MVGARITAVDSNLLVYASLLNHPAAETCERYLTSKAVWVTNIANLVELLRVLVGVYGVPEQDAVVKFQGFGHALTVDDLTPGLASAALATRSAHKIDLNDAVLLETCRLHGVTVQATDDGALARACESVGIGVENPIDDTVRACMADWEARNLPPKGLPRVLTQVHRWMSARDPVLAADFLAATQALAGLP